MGGKYSLANLLGQFQDILHQHSINHVVELAMGAKCTVHGLIERICKELYGQQHHIP